MNLRVIIHCKSLREERRGLDVTYPGVKVHVHVHEILSVVNCVSAKEREKKMGSVCEPS